jgi:hypothetical protein
MHLWVVGDCRATEYLPTINTIVTKNSTLNLLLAFPLLCSAATPQTGTPSDTRWAVKVAGRDQRPTKGPNCHPLEYFTDSGHLKDFDYVHHIPKPYPEGISDEVESNRRGEINGFAVYDVVHHIDAGEAPADWEHFSYPPGLLKMVLVERKDGLFCEIFHEQNSDGEFTPSPSYFADVSSQKVLAVHDPIPGVGNYFNEAYWTFDEDGPIPLNLDIIKQTVDKLLPPNMQVYRGVGFQIEALSYDMGLLQDSPEGGCCASRQGSVHLEFALTNHQLIVVGRKFDPEGSGAVIIAPQKPSHVLIQAPPEQIKKSVLALFAQDGYSVESDTASDLKISVPFSVAERSARIRNPETTCRHVRSFLFSPADQGTTVIMVSESVCRQGHSSVVTPDRRPQDIQSMQNTLAQLKATIEESSPSLSPPPSTP